MVKEHIDDRVAKTGTEIENEKIKIYALRSNFLFKIMNDTNDEMAQRYYHFTRKNPGKDVRGPTNSCFVTSIRATNA